MELPLGFIKEIHALNCTNGQVIILVKWNSPKRK